MAITIVTNNHQRPLFAGHQIPRDVYDAEFDYLGPFVEENEDLYIPRFFRYQGSWYDVNDGFERNETLSAHGFDGFQSDTYFSGIAIRYGSDWSGQPEYDSVIVARIAFLDD